LEAKVAQDVTVLGQRMKTPRAAAVAGIVFALLLMGSQVTIWLSIPADPLAPPVEVSRHAKAITLALDLLPFAGIAFLWFLAVMRDRLGELEDRFFATVLLGSGLLYVAMMFTSTGLAGAVVTVLVRNPGTMIDSAAYVLGRQEVYRFMSVFSTKMSAVFLLTSSTIFWRTRVLPRPLAYLGYVVAVVLLLSIGMTPWISVIFPLWVLTISLYILLEGGEKRTLQREPRDLDSA
jgi:hypothetical protein